MIAARKKSCKRDGEVINRDTPDDREVSYQCRNKGFTFEKSFHCQAFERSSKHVEYLSGEFDLVQ